MHDASTHAISVSNLKAPDLRRGDKTGLCMQSVQLSCKLIYKVEAIYLGLAKVLSEQSTEISKQSSNIGKA